MDRPLEKKPVKRGRPRMEEQARRAAILQAAFDAFVELGFAQTTTATVAARAKVSKRTLYETFGDKTSLFASVIREQQYLLLDLPRPPDETLPLTDTLEMIFRLDLPEEAARAREATLNLIVRESVLFPQLSDYLYDSEVMRSQEALMEWLTLEMKRERIATNEPEIYAGMLMDIVFGALLPRRRSADSGARLQRIEHIRKRLAIAVQGMIFTVEKK